MTYNWAVFRNGLLWKRTLGYPMARKVAGKLTGDVQIKNEIYEMVLIPTNSEKGD